MRLYNVDGHTSPLLQTLHIPTIPFTSQSSVSFHPSGTHLLLTGNVRTTPCTTSNLGPQNTQRAMGNAILHPGIAKAECMEITAFSPTGEMLAVAGRGGMCILWTGAAGAGRSSGRSSVGLVAGFGSCGGRRTGRRRAWRCFRGMPRFAYGMLVSDGV